MKRVHTWRETTDCPAVNPSVSPATPSRTDGRGRVSRLVNPDGMTDNSLRSIVHPVKRDGSVLDYSLFPAFRVRRPRPFVIADAAYALTRVFNHDLRSGDLRSCTALSRLQVASRRRVRNAAYRILSDSTVRHISRPDNDVIATCPSVS